MKRLMNRVVKKTVSFVLSLAMVVTVCPQTKLIDVSAAEDDNTPYNLSYGRPAYASSENGALTADKAVDGNDSSLDSRWQADASDKNEWIYVDLGKEADIDHIYLHWEDAYAKSYKIQFSNDEETWIDAYKKGKTDPEDEEEEQAVSIKTTITNEYGTANDNTQNRKVDISWTAFDGASYTIYVDQEDEEHYAEAQDGYHWKSHNVANGNITLPEGEHTIIIVAKKDGTELGRGTKKITIPPYGDKADGEEDTGETEDPKAKFYQTIEKDSLLEGVEAKARYVRVVTYERGTGYGASLFEFQVWGTGGSAKRPVDYGENLALNKNVTVSSLSDAWWLYHDGVKDEEAVKSSNAVDGNIGTSWLSDSSDNQWMYVDLGQAYDIGRVVLKWEKDAGKVYDIQTSADAKNWKTVYRKQDGIKEESVDVPLYAAGVRYVRVYAYARTDIRNGVSIKELEVYEYKEGDTKPTYTIEEIPGRTKKNMKKGSYVGQDPTIEAAFLPTYIDKENIKLPIASNDWWQSAMITQFGNTMCTLPFKTGYSKKGLSVLTATSGWLPEMKETDVNVSVETEQTPDFYILPENTDGTTAYDRVHNYSDYAVELQLCDENGVQMTSTHVKGSPYIYCEFPEGKENVYITSQNLEGIFDDNGNAILAKGEKIVTDHIGIVVRNKDNPKKENGTLNYYCISLPAGTTIKNNDGKLKLTFSGKDKYMSVGTMLKKDDLKTYYQHGYAFVTGTSVTYAYDTAMSKIVSKYDVTTKVKRDGFDNTTMQLMLPHQWRISEQNKEAKVTYTSVRGDMHGIWNNHFETTDVFEGILPEFAMPKSENFDQNKVMEYLTALVSSTSNITPAADAYWEGKNLHPLAMGMLMADQLGETEMRDLFGERLKARLVDWFTYSGKDDVSFFVYDNSWGTLYYGQSEFGANWGICDHHFTYGYFVFSAAVLATYDDEFYNDYKDMIDMLVRDYANPSDKDSEYCKFRAYDLYEGHSWAGGYADNNNGNNQESASESLFSWVGMYLWGIRSENNSYRDAGVFGFKNEMEAIKEYWFDYNGENWIKDWPYEVVAQVYGGGNFYGTFFGGQPLYCYGIQWLPLSEYLTYYGMDQKRAAEIYKGLENDTESSKAKAEIALKDDIEKAKATIAEKNKEIEDAQAEIDAEGTTDERKAELQKIITEAKEVIQTARKPIDEIENYASPDNGWQHITWTFLSQTDADRALEKFNTDPSKVQDADRANVYWFMNTMKEVGQKTEDIVATGDCSATVYCKTSDDGTKTYTAMAWNPSSEAKTVTFKKTDGTEVATATIESKALISFEIDPDEQVKLTQVPAPTMKATDLSSGTVTENLTGTKTFGDTQMVELSCSDKDATIYYTTDGTAPTTNSTRYDGNKILVSSDTTIKAIAIKEGSIDSTYASATIKVEGDVIQNSENLALHKTATASSENGGDKAANAVDGITTSRWQAEKADKDEWIQVDLGDVYAVNTVKLNWETAYASKYKIQVSTDGENWTDVATQNGQKGEVTTTFAAINAQYVRMQGLSMATNYGYSLYEFEVYGAKQPDAPTITPLSGTYDGSQTVTMSTTVKGAEIKYTLDGTEPTENSATYTGPVTIDKSTIVKAVTYRKGMILSDPVESDIIIKGTVALNKTEANVAVGNTLQLSAYADDAVTWTSSNNNVATVNENGLVKGTGEGETTITATLPNGKSATCKVTVTEAIHITSIELSETALEMKQKTSKTLKLTINPADTTDDTTPTWTSDNPNVVEVNSNGTLTARGLGEATITVTVEKGDRQKTATCKVTVVPIPTSDMAGDVKYNLALNKPVTVYPAVAEGKAEFITDGKLVAVDGEQHCAISKPNWGYTGEGYAIIDLGNIYDASAIDQISIQYKNIAENDTVLGRTYQIEYSANGVDFETVYTSDKIATSDFDNERCTHAKGMNVSEGQEVRYVKVYYPNVAQYGIQISEIAVFATEKEATIIEPDYCDDPAGLEVSSANFGEISYTIIPEKGQEDYQYIVFLDGNKIEGPIAAGTYTLTDVAAGIYDVKVVSYHDKKVSKGITKSVEVKTVSSYINTDRNIAKGCNVTVESIETSEGNKEPNSLTDGTLSKDNGICVHTTHKEKEATITIDLGKEYAKETIDEVLMAFKADNTNPTAYNIEFSGDGTTYQKVIDVTGATFKDVYEDKFDASEYNQNTVRYVRINLTDGNYEWGYQLSEVAVISKPSEEHKVTVDGNPLAANDNGTYTLPSKAEIGYFDGTDMYKPGATITVDKDMAFTTVNKADLAVGISEGASMRLSNKLETTGLRFKGTVKSEITGLLDSKTITAGMLITTSDLYATNESTLKVDSTYSKGNLENIGWVDGHVGEYYGAVVNIAPANRARAYIARAYVTVNYQDGSKSEPIYSGMSKYRSPQTVAQAVLSAMEKEPEKYEKYNAYKDMLNTFAADN